MTALAIVGAVGLAVIAFWPHVTRAPLRAREEALREDLFTFRSCLDHYFADKGRYPASLEALTSEKYLRRIPVDPFTRSNETWRVTRDDESNGLIDVHSGSQETSSDGTRYDTW